MSQMQWRRMNGSTGEYNGPLVALGHGIPRKLGSFGLRRAGYDLAFGYVSGFPVRDIIAFSFRSLFPHKTLEVMAQIAEPFDGYVGTVHLLCPECGDIMPATVTAEIENPEGADVGEATLVCTPDMTDIHAHMWTHSEVRDSDG